MNQNKRIKRPNKPREELTLKDDILFKAFFAKKGNEKYLKSFLEALLDIKIKEIEVIQESTLDKLTLNEKLGRLDIKATINNEEIINIEMQVENENNMKQRTVYYGSRLVAEQLVVGDKYEELKPVILINILNFNLFETPEYHTETVIVSNKHREYEVIQQVKYHFIELPKFRKAKPELTNILECWLAFIDNRKGGLVKMAEKKEKIIKEAGEELEEILSVGALKEIIEYRRTAILEENSRRSYAMEKGRKEGLEQGIKQGIKQGMKQGMKQGIERGIKQGIEENTKKIAKAMLKEKIDIENIMKCTKLSKKELDSIMKEK